MSTKITHVFLFMLQVRCAQFSTTSQAKVVTVTAAVQSNPPQVTLSCDNGTDSACILLFRREKDAPDGFILMEDTATAVNSFTDTNVAVGMTYEYGIQRFSGGIYAYGYATVPVEAPLTESRGKVLVFVDAALQMPLATELERFERDLTGDGWQVVWHQVDTSATEASLKNQIVTDYDGGNAGVNSILLFGEIPVPYSGNTNWDGHPNHQGAWPADTYYGDVDGNWTDISVNNTTPDRPQNDNVPGDGKFDQSIVPSALEIAVGRVDFSNLSETTFGTSRVELYRRYLNKNHNWRTKQYTVANKALVDDNFGYFGGEAFGANGWRNANPLVGIDSVMAADFFGDTDGEGFLMGYGCGGGSYTSANGVGNSTQFANDSVNIVFSMIFGSYHGDWDYSPNPFMPSALASKGGILSCSWAGRPHWFYHHLAAGQTLGYCTLATQNTCDNNGYFPTIGTCGAHVTLLGDPTLRAQIVAPASDLAAVNKCSSVELAWTASTVPGLLGYHVYRSTAQYGEYERLTSDLVTDTVFEDETTPEDTLYYQVRAVVLENTPSGRFYNSSTGVFTNTVFASGEIPSVSFTGDTITCLNPVATVTANTDAPSPTFLWTTPGGAIEGPTVTIDQPGTYVVTVTDGVTGCFATASPAITNNSVPPVAFPEPQGELTCTQTEVQVLANPGGPGYTFEWTGPGGFSSNVENPVVILAGEYALSLTDPENGCMSQYDVTVVENTVAPAIDLGPPIALTCVEPSLLVDCPPIPFVSCQLTDESGNVFLPPVTLTEAGLYTLIVPDVNNGCTASDTLAIEMDTLPPDLDITGSIELECGATTLEAVSFNPNTAFNWTGGNFPEPGNPVQTITQPGTYTVEAVDVVNGCTTTETVAVIGTPVMELQINMSVDCEGFANVDIFITGGTPPYNYIFDPLPPIPPGVTFSLVVTDAEGCTVEATGVNTAQPSDLEVALDHTNETVSGAADGTATAQPSGGSPPYEYLWSDGQTTPTATHLAPGDYSVVVTDANGCTSTESVTIEAGTNAADEVPGLLRLIAYPNPVGDYVTFEILLKKEMEIGTTLLDATGRILQHNQPGRLTGFNGSFDMAFYPPGLYFLKFSLDGRVVSRRVVKVE